MAASAPPTTHAVDCWPCPGPQAATGDHQRRAVLGPYVRRRHYRAGGTLWTHLRPRTWSHPRRARWYVRHHRGNEPQLKDVVDDGSDAPPVVPKKETPARPSILGGTERPLPFSRGGRRGEGAGQMTAFAHVRTCTAGPMRDRTRLGTTTGFNPFAGPPTSKAAQMALASAAAARGSADGGAPTSGAAGDAGAAAAKPAPPSDEPRTRCAAGTKDCLCEANVWQNPTRRARAR